MRTRMRWLAVALTAAMGWGPVSAWGQEVPPADPQLTHYFPQQLPLPLFHDRPETGGLYTAIEFLFFHQPRPIRGQVIATRGVVDSNGSLTGTGLPGIPLGTHRVALRADDLGRTSWQPGYNLTVGWKFSDGSAIEASWWKLFQTQYTGGAAGVPPQFLGPIGNFDSFLYANVFNFPPEYAGPEYKVIPGLNNPVMINGLAFLPVLGIPDYIIPIGPGVGAGVPGVDSEPEGPFAQALPLPQPGALYGIWNGADSMTIKFTQRFDQFDITYRMPLCEDYESCCRTFFLAGGRFAWIWERFQWRATARGYSTLSSVNRGTVFIDPATGTVVDQNRNPLEPGQPIVIINPLTGQIVVAPLIQTVLAPDEGPQNSAVYNNIVSNRMYGPFLGYVWEKYLGYGFAISADFRAALLMNIVKERASYELADKTTKAKRARTEFTVVPELQAAINLWWYPIEGVEIRAGYNAMGFFNTIASPNPVAFDFGNMSPPWENRFLRLFHGLNVGIGFIF
ncbi:MAG: hypothetical protein ACK4RK_01840 [Gemmataceae bacterium]